LSDDRLGVSAAVRLMRLADLQTLCVPENLSAAQAKRLRLLPLPPQGWALGLLDDHDETRLRAPVIITADGQPQLAADGMDEELAVLHVSRDADIFPHLVILPDRVLPIGEEILTAIVLSTPRDVRFDLGREHGFHYVALVLTSGAPDTEVARYRWDPYELTFMGPASDKLPDPPGGKFQIDLPASRRLEPVGGEIPQPEPERRPEPVEGEWT
jgi:hypothetical protein